MDDQTATPPLGPPDASWADAAEARFPAEFDPEIYRRINSTAARLDDADARAHYRATGRPGGYRANALATREALIDLVADAPALLEIGGPDAPAFPAGIGREVLRPGVDPRAGGMVYDAVYSNHLIQTVPDLVAHLRQVAAALAPGGFYLLMVPDKRYCLDHFQPATTIAAVLDAHRRGDTIASWRAQVDNLTLGTHNDPARHWLGDHGSVRDLNADSIVQSLRLTTDPGAATEGQSYRTWFFTPASFRAIAWMLRDLDLVDLEPFRVYPTLRDRSEFWAVLRKPVPGAAPLPREEDADDESPVLPFDGWSLMRAPAAGIGYAAIDLLASRETETERRQRFNAAVLQAAVDQENEVETLAEEWPSGFPVRATEGIPSLSLPGHGIQRVLVSFCHKGASGILLGLYTPTPVPYFQPLALPDEITRDHQKAHGLTMDDHFVYAALSGQSGQAVLVLSRNDLSVQGLHLLRRAADVHSILTRDGMLYVVSTGTDEVLRYPLEGGVPGNPERYWAPEQDDARADLRHYNAIWPEGDGFLIAAMDRRGLFPAGSSRMNADGIILSIPSGEVVVDGLWFPHSVMRIDGDLAYLQSGCSTLNVHGQGVIRNLPGWPRGLCRVPGMLLIGTSENSAGAINNLPTHTVRCTIVRCDYPTLAVTSSLDLSWWGRGIYDLLPLDTPHTGA